MSAEAKILVIDDELVICKSCEKIFRRAGHLVSTATSGREALQMLERESFDVVFTDLKMMDLGGMEVLQTVGQKYPSTVVVVITGYATVASAVETMRSGAFDFLPKPFTPTELMAVLDRAIEKRRIIQIGLNELENEETDGFEGFIGRSRCMQEVYKLIRKVAPTDSTVLIIGESGTGKDLAAKAIHNQSKRRREKFMAIDISTLSSGLLESELFGHVKGSFTGAVNDKSGLFEIADGGTIFLDEIGNLPLETQSRLLRLLQDKEFLPVGGTSVKKADVRLIFATNQNLKQLVASDKFREDLYYRLNVFPIKLPPLRERPEDIPDLAMFFLRRHCTAMGRSVPSIDSAAMDSLMKYHWPGNIRELEHTIERLIILVDEDRIQPAHIAAGLFSGDSSFRSLLPKNNEELKRLKKQIRESSVQEIEKLFIEEALVRNDWNISRAARDVNMQRSNFHSLIKKYGLTKPRPSV